MEIQRVNSLPDISDLIVESKTEGFRFVQRLQQGFDDGSNRFDQQGEFLFAVYHYNSVIAIGGINRMIYERKPVGRLRRFYVAREHRNCGTGSLLLNHIESHAFHYFDMLVLYTDTTSAALFYEKNDYIRVDMDNISHIKYRTGKEI